MRSPWKRDVISRHSRSAAGYRVYVCDPASISAEAAAAAAAAEDQYHNDDDGTCDRHRHQYAPPFGTMYKSHSKFTTEFTKSVAPAVLKDSPRDLYPDNNPDNNYYYYYYYLRSQSRLGQVPEGK